MAYPVKWFSSEMHGAPSLGDSTDGALTALLKAVLVNGFGALTITDLSWDPVVNAAVATVGTHTYLVDTVVAVSGVTPSAYNGEHRVVKIATGKIWFDLAGGDPGSAGSGAMGLKVAPLGWSLTHESGDGKVAIYRPADIAASGNISLRVDNTAWSGWTGTVYGSIYFLAKVQLVEDVVDINTYTLVYDHRWPATQRYSTAKTWDFIGDSQLFYWSHSISPSNYPAVYCFGYIKSIRLNDRYHAILVPMTTTTPSDGSFGWVARDNNNPQNYGTTLLTYNDTTNKVMARPYHQLGGVTSWWLKGLFSRMGTGISVPNGPDNGFYLIPDPIMVVESGNHLRGHLPGLVTTFSDMLGWDRKNLTHLPALPNKIVRFIRPLYQPNTFQQDARCLLGFDITGPWR